MSAGITYHAPQRLDAALALLDEHRENALVVAGGTEAIRQLRAPGAQWRHVIDISRLAELHHILETSDGRLRIGALITCSELAMSQVIETRAPILVKAALHIGAPQIRNMATVGGNISTRSCGGDLLPALLVLDADLTLQRRSGARRLPLAEYLALPPRPDELLTTVDCEIAPRGTALLRLAVRRSLAPTIASAAVFLQADAAKRRWTRVRVALGASGTTVRALHAEAELAAAACFGEKFAAAAHRASEQARSEVAAAADMWGSARYRRYVVGVLTLRALIEAASQAVGG